MEQNSLVKPESIYGVIINAQYQAVTQKMRTKHRVNTMIENRRNKFHIRRIILSLQELTNQHSTFNITRWESHIYQYVANIQLSQTINKYRFQHLQNRISLFEQMILKMPVMEQETVATE